MPLRRHVFSCLPLLLAPLFAQAQAPASSADSTPVQAAGEPAAYVPKTPYDNSPYRFNAGQRFTAAEFDAWMEARGIRVAKGKPAAFAEVAASAPAGSDVAVGGGEPVRTGVVACNEGDRC